LVKPLVELKAEWQSLIGTPAPNNSRQFLEHRLAYRIQELALGGLGGPAAKLLDALADEVEGKIFVGGLSWQTTEESMRFHFEKFGELSDIAIMIDKRTGQPRGFGFITMKDPAAADIVVSTEHTIDGRVVDVKRAVPRDMAPAPTRAESKKIFVGGLPTEVTEKEFEEYFGTFGLVKVRPFSSSYAGWKAQQRGTD
jgi:RNA recognition motif-containing protein